MAEALIRGITKAGLAAGDQIIAVDPDDRRRGVLADTYKVGTSDSAGSLKVCDTVILAVKPQIMAVVLDECREIFGSKPLVISIAAGIPLSFLESRLDPRCRVIRVMPNTPALVLEGASALSGGTHAGPADLEIAGQIFSAIGRSVVLAERYLDAVTGLSGSGPAYVFQFIEALTDSGVKMGLGRPDAEALVLQTILGAVKLAMESGEHPAVLKAMVTSPGGTTIAGLHELEKAGFTAGIMNAVEAATNRSVELGKLVSG